MVFVYSPPLFEWWIVMQWTPSVAPPPVPGLPLLRQGQMLQEEVQVQAVAKPRSPSLFYICSTPPWKNKSSSDRFHLKTKSKNETVA